MSAQSHRKFITLTNAQKGTGPDATPAPRYRRPRRGLIGVAALTFAAIAVPAFSAGPAADLRSPPRHTPTTTSTLTWIDDLIEILKSLITLLGGNPTDVEQASDAESAMSIVASYWNAHGLPSGITNAQRLALIGYVDSTSSLLNSAPSGVDTGAIQNFRSTLASIRAAAALPDGP